MPSPPYVIYHIVDRSTWDTAMAAGRYAPHSLDDEGFIHCSIAGQVVGVANALFWGRDDLILVEIHSSTLGYDLVYEDSYGLGQDFPHVYRPLNPQDAIRIVDFPMSPDGSFTLPPDLLG